MARLQLALLGPFQAAIEGTPITQFESDKVRALLAYLAVEAPQPHRRSALAALFWPEYPEEKARKNLRQALFNLRQALGDTTADPPFLLITRQTIQFNQTLDDVVDVVEFERLISVTQSHAHESLSTCSFCLAQLAAAVQQYREPFLADFYLSDSNAFATWSMAKQEALHRSVLTALHVLAASCEAQGQDEQACSYWRRQTALAPWQEEGHQRLIQRLAHMGRYEAALAQYESCRQALADELGVEPTLATRQWSERIRAARTSRHHQLPPQLTPFLDRKSELAQMAAYLAQPSCRLLTLWGPGGIGKTSLALRAAAQHQHKFLHGVCFVPLAPLVTADQFVPAVMQALALAEEKWTYPQLLAYLQEKNLLLILDNLEHLPGVTRMLKDMLTQAPGVTLWVTSRTRLHLRAETVIEVPGLPFPPPDAAAAAIASYEAVQLFVQQARRVRAAFALTAANQTAVARICRLVAGIPLGIELAAVWARTLSCAEIAAEIERDFNFLTSSLPDAPSRHRSLRASFTYSWNLLSAEEQRAFRQLSIFPGRFDRHAAQVVAGASLSVLAALGDHAFLTGGSTGQFAILPLLRQYGAEKLSTRPGEQGQVEAHYQQYQARRHPYLG